MTITREEASQALGEVGKAQGRIREQISYSHSAPYLIIWGLVWMGADLCNQFEPRWLYAWPVAIVLGVVASIAAGMTQRRPGDATKGGWRNVAVFGVIFAFFIALFAVIPVTSNVEVHSIFGLVFGFLYMGFGLWMGWRILALGAALAALTLFGFYEVTTWYGLYMGLVSGGALILGGLWLKRI